MSRSLPWPLPWRRTGPAATEAPSPEAALQQRNLRALLIVTASNNTAWDLVTPFIPLLVLEIVGGDAVVAATWSGLAVGIAPLMTAVSAPLWTAFAQRYGARRAMLRTLATSPAIIVLLAFADTIWQLMILRFLTGALGGFFVLVHALAAQTAPRDRVGQAVGSLQAISMICLAVIPPIAGFLTDIWGLRSNFLLGAAILLVGFVVMWRGYTMPPETAGAAAQAKAAHKAGTSWQLLRQPELAVVAFVILVGQYVERTFWPLAPLLLVEMDPGSNQLGLMTGLVLGIGSGATAISALAAGTLARKISPRLLLLGALACGCITLPPLALAESVWTFVGIRIVMGLLTGCVVTLGYAYVATILPADRLSVAFAMFATVAMAASALGPISMSTLSATAGLRSPLIVGAIGFGVCAALLLLGRAGGRR